MPDLENRLQEYFGFGQFRPLQKEIIEQLLAGNSAVGILPTGAGKSLCYQLPALLLPGLTIVISPLISLMKDQTDSLVARGVRAMAINSHDTAAEGRSKLAALAAGEAKLVFVAPERLNNPAFLEACARVQVSLLAVDEAHCVSQWGHDFRPEYQQIGTFHAAVGRPPMLALTATARPTVQQDLMVQLGIADAPLFRASANRPNLWLGLEACNTEAERLAVITHLLGAEPGCAVVYATSRRETEALSDSLTASLGEPVACYHAGMGPEERTAVQNQFMTDLVRVVVATSAFGMGIDKPDIRTVIHAGIPDSLEAYFQEIGRAGRDGAPARCSMVLIPGRDMKMREFLVKQSDDATAVDRFRRIVSYVYLSGGECRRAFLMRYFGEQQEPQAEACCSSCHPLVIPRRAELAAARPAARKGRRGAATPAKQGTAETTAMQPATPQALQLMEHLKQWRRRKAADLGVPAFVVFGDRDLAGVAEAAPTDLMALSACRGIGPAKLKQYGAELLAEVAAFVPPPPAPAGAAAAPKEDRATLVARAGALFAEGRPAEAVAAEVGRSEGTVWQYLLDWIDTEPTGAWKEAVLHVLSRDAYREIVPALQGDAGERLKPVYDSLGGRYTYDQIRVARAVQARAARGSR
jgi:ATP-dependent DNA helicase RecQ